MTWSFPMDEDGGFIVIDKPKGPTSHQIDYWVREITGIAKVGHVGTLDPQATGVLAMALGKATRLIDIAHEQPKEYVGIMKLHGDVERTRLEEVLREFTGEVIQLPPMRSAVARRLRTRKIYELELLEIKERDVLFRVKCESGTYIRTLCVDIGYVLGTGANMTELRRTKTGVFFEDQTVTLQDLSDAVELSRTGKPNLLKAMFHDPTFLFKEKAKIVVKDSTIHNISKGSDLYPGGIRKIIGEPMKGDRVMVSSESGKFLGTGIMLANFMDITDLKVVDFDRIMVDPVEGNVNKIEEKPKVNSADKLHIHTFDKTINIPKIRGNESEVKLRTDRPSDYRKNIEAAPGKKSFVKGKENSFRDKGKERRPGSEEKAKRFGRDRTSESFKPQFKRREERPFEKNNFVSKDKGKGEQKNYRFSGERKENFTGKEKENVRTFPSEPFPRR
ncbi:MAG: RNA-guided pseudouridylation complex pseudouridine synthase subunit Cbf5, partial [Thermoplasmataceae archaeon]